MDKVDHRRAKHRVFSIEARHGKLATKQRSHLDSRFWNHVTCGNNRPFSSLSATKIYMCIPCFVLRPLLYTRTLYPEPLAAKLRHPWSLTSPYIQDSPEDESRIARDWAISQTIRFSARPCNPLQKKLFHRRPFLRTSCSVLVLFCFVFDFCFLNISAF